MTINDDYFIIYNGKLLSKNIDILQFINIESTILLNSSNSLNINNYINNYKYNNIEIIPRQKGGGFIDLFKSIIQIGEFFLKIFDVITWIFQFIAWFIQFVIWVFTDLININTLVKEFYNSMMVIVLVILRLPLDLCTGFFAMTINAMSSWMQGFWGWDQSSLTKSDKESNYFQSMDMTKGKKYYLTSSNTVPFSVILGTILCPPIGVFMDMGTSGWLNIIVCCILTLAFYIPGLFYALLIIYS
jgi:uncharacterized membrane protein YqaE (UPF0057 family)